MTTSEVVEAEGRSTPRRAPAIDRAQAFVPRLGWWLMCVTVLVLVGLPLAQIIARLAAHGHDAYSSMFKLPNLARTLRLTLFLGLGSAVFALVFGVLLGWWVSRLGGLLGRIARAVPMLPLLVPPQVTVIGWTFLLSPRIGYLNQILRKLPLLDRSDHGPFDIYTAPWMMVVMGLFLMPYVFFFVNDAFASIGTDLEAAARVSGASRTRAFFTILLPLLRPAIVYGFALVVVLGAGQFTVPLLLGRQRGLDVLTTEIYKLTESYPIPYALGSAIASPLLVLGIVIVLIQRRAIGDPRRFIVGRDAVRRGDTRWWGAIPIAVYAMVVVAPLLAVLHIALSPYWSGNMTTSHYSLRNFRAVFADHRVMGAFTRSLEVSVIAVVLVVTLTFFVAMALAFGRGGRIARRLVDIAVNVPIGVPATVLGFGVLFAYSQSPFRWYGKPMIVVVVYVTIMLPFATRLQLAALLTQGIDYRDASSASGASAWRTVTRVVAPLSRQGIVSATIFTLVLCLYEFSASLMVRSTQNEVIGGIFYEYYTTGLYPKLAALAVMMVAVAAALVVVVLLVGAERRGNATFRARGIAAVQRLRPGATSTGLEDRADEIVLAGRG